MLRNIEADRLTLFRSGPAAAALSALVLLGACSISGPPSSDSRLDLISSVMRTVRGEYVESVGDEELVQGALKGIPAT